MPTKNWFDPANAPHIVPSGRDILEYVEPYQDRMNDTERLERVLAALLDTLSGSQRLEVLNRFRGRETREDDWPKYVAEDPSDD